MADGDSGEDAAEDPPGCGCAEGPLGASSTLRKTLVCTLRCRETTRGPCSGLSVCVSPPRINMLKPNPQCEGVRRRV